MPTPVILPRQGQSVESCILTSWQVKADDTVTAGQIIASIETDKATFDIESPADGTVLALFFEEGDDIPVLTTIAAIGQPGEDFSTLRPGTAAPSGQANPHTQSPPTPTEASPVASSAAAAPDSPGTGVSPRARKLAASQGVDAYNLVGSGPGGRVIARDVVGAAAADSLEIPVTGIRKIIAERMHSSLASTAQLTLNRSFDATAIQSFRRKLKRTGATFGLPAVTINDLIVYATAQTLVRYPEVNAHFLGDRIVQYRRVHLGIAVDTPRGLMVPVLQDAATLPISEVSARIRPLADACQNGSINPDHLAGGTFTITNLGALGVETFTPVLNTPEVAVLGVGGLTVKPVRTPVGIDHVDAIHLSLTIDHQAVDGAPAARFLKDLCEALENIEILLAAGA